MTSDPRVRLGHRSAGGLEKWADVTVHRSTDAAFTGLRRGSFRLLAAHPDPDAAVAIPMLGMVDPLNVSVAAAPIVYEAMRQRREAGMYAERRIPDACFERLAFEWTHPAVAAWRRRQDLPCDG